MHMGDLGVAQDCAGNVLFEIFERLGGVASRPQATTARMKHYMQDAATDLGVELPLTKLQYTAFMNEGVPRLRMKAVVTRHLLPVLLRMIEILSHQATTTTAEFTCACDVSASCKRNSTAGGGSDRGKGRGNYTASTSHSTCRLRGIG